MPCVCVWLIVVPPLACPPCVRSDCCAPRKPPLSLVCAGRPLRSCSHTNTNNDHDIDTPQDALSAALRGTAAARGAPVAAQTLTAAEAEYAFEKKSSS
ncbi:hypothetical protein T492DRAFT_439327 [Pavlovales sp. CCMP2436]|nr:hypothetical protein T492DRAFT_439327 [Pavlovales sp. CCMP2436]